MKELTTAHTGPSIFLKIWEEKPKDPEIVCVKNSVFQLIWRLNWFPGAFSKQVWRKHLIYRSPHKRNKNCRICSKSTLLVQTSPSIYSWDTGVWTAVMKKDSTPSRKSSLGRIVQFRQCLLVVRAPPKKLQMLRVWQKRKLQTKICWTRLKKKHSLRERGPSKSFCSKYRWPTYPRMNYFLQWTSVMPQPWPKKSSLNSSPHFLRQRTPLISPFKNSFSSFTFLVRISKSLFGTSRIV